MEVLTLNPFDFLLTSLLNVKTGDCLNNKTFNCSYFLGRVVYLKVVLE